MSSNIEHRTDPLPEHPEWYAGESGDLPGTLKQIVRSACDLFKADLCVMFAFNPFTRKFFSPIFDGLFEHWDSNRFASPRSIGITWQVLRDSSGVLIIEDLDRQPGFANDFTRLEGIQAYVALALRTIPHQKPLAVLYIDFRHPRSFNEVEQAQYRLFAEQASFLLQQAWLLYRYHTVSNIGREIIQNLGTGTLETLFDKLVVEVGNIVDTSHTLYLAVYKPQARKRDLYMVEAGQRSFQADRPVRSGTAWVIKEKKSLLIRHRAEAAQLGVELIPVENTAPREESLIYVPLLLHDVPLGVLSVQHREPDVYDQEDQRVLELLASYLALALSNMRLFANLDELNKTGQLLTQQLESPELLQLVADQIRDKTKSDLVDLYSYDPGRDYIILPQQRSGELLVADFHGEPLSRREDDIAWMAVHQDHAVWAHDSAKLYGLLGGDTSKQQGSFAKREQISSTAVVPLRVQDMTVGILFINFRIPQYFDEPQQQLIAGLALYAAIAIKNARAFRTLSERHGRELEILRQVDRELSVARDLEAVLGTILRLAHEHVPAEEAAILIYDQETGELVTWKALGRNEGKDRKQLIIEHENIGLTGWVLRHKRSVLVKDVRQEAHWRAVHVPLVADIVAELDVPLLDDTEVVGIISFESNRPGAFSEADLGFIETLAGQVVLAVKRAQDYEREKQMAAEAQAINMIGKEITSQLDPKKVYGLILANALKLTGSTAGSLRIYDPSDNQLWIAVEEGMDKEGRRRIEHLTLDRGVTGLVARQKRTVRIADVTAPEWKGIYLPFREEMHSELAVPMLQGPEEQLRGVINLESPLPNKFRERDERLLEALADLAVIALQNAERYEQAEKSSQRFRLLYQAAQELGSLTSLDQLKEAYEIVLRLARDHSQSSVAIRRYDAVTRELVLMHASQDQMAPLLDRRSVDSGLHGQAARDRNTISVHDTAELGPEDRQSLLRNPNIQTLIIIPIHLSKESTYYYGNLRLGHYTIGYFRDADIQLFEGLAHQLAMTIHRLEALEARQEVELRAKALEAMALIGQSGFELAHRLGNDLGLVRMYVNNIRSILNTNSIVTTTVERELDKILQDVGRVLSLSKQLKQQLTEFQEGSKVERTFVLMPVTAIVEEALQMFPSSSEDIRLEKEFDKNLGNVRVVPSQIVEILSNLLTNAIEAMPDGGTIWLRARRTDQYVELEVSDNGPGISLDKQSLIFDLFYSTKRSSGFGLWSSQRNALANGGDLRVRSLPGAGTTFTLRLPQKDQSNSL